MKHNITIYSTRGGVKNLSSDADTWGDLKPEVASLYSDIDSLIPTEGTNKTTFESRDSVLPEGDFVLFLRPKRFKAGTNLDDMSYTELRGLLDDDMKAEIKDRFGRNFTQLSKTNLLEFLKSVFGDESPEEEDSDEDQFAQSFDDDEIHHSDKDFFDLTEETDDDGVLQIFKNACDDIVDNVVCIDEEPEKYTYKIYVATDNNRTVRLYQIMIVNENDNPEDPSDMAVKEAYNKFLESLEDGYDY